MSFITFVLLVLTLQFLITFTICCIQQWLLGKVYIVSDYNDRWFCVMSPEDVRTVISGMLIPVIGYIFFCYIFGYSIIFLLVKIYNNIPNPLERIFPDND